MQWSIMPDVYITPVASLYQHANVPGLHLHVPRFDRASALDSDLGGGKAPPAPFPSPFRWPVVSIHFAAAAAE